MTNATVELLLRNSTNQDLFILEQPNHLTMISGILSVSLEFSQVTGPILILLYLVLE